MVVGIRVISISFVLHENDGGISVDENVTIQPNGEAIAWDVTRFLYPVHLRGFTLISVPLASEWTERETHYVPLLHR